METLELLVSYRVNACPVPAVMNNLGELEASTMLITAIQPSRYKPVHEIRLLRDRSSNETSLECHLFAVGVAEALAEDRQGILEPRKRGDRHPSHRTERPRWVQSKQGRFASSRSPRPRPVLRTQAIVLSPMEQERSSASTIAHGSRASTCLRTNGSATTSPR